MKISDLLLENENPEAISAITSFIIHKKASGKSSFLKSELLDELEIEGIHITPNDLDDILASNEIKLIKNIDADTISLGGNSIRPSNEIDSKTKVADMARNAAKKRNK